MQYNSKELEKVKTVQRRLFNTEQLNLKSSSRLFQIIPIDEERYYADMDIYMDMHGMTKEEYKIACKENAWFFIDVQLQPKLQEQENRSVYNEAFWNCVYGKLSKTEYYKLVGNNREYAAYIMKKNEDGTIEEWQLNDF